MFQKIDSHWYYRKIEKMKLANKKHNDTRKKSVTLR
jgi:hypothetical protein